MKNGRKFFQLSFIFIIVTGIIIFVRAIGIAAGENAQTAAAVSAGNNTTMLGFAAMGAVGISCFTSAYALAKIGSAAMGAMSEKPEIGGRALIFLGMAEGIAIYGLIIAIMLINKM